MSECSQTDDEPGDRDDPAGSSQLTQQSGDFRQLQAVESEETSRVHQTPAAKDQQGQRQDDQNYFEPLRFLHSASALGPTYAFQLVVGRYARAQRAVRRPGRRSL